ncbi:MAG: hypothetical protein H6994_03775 [Pseudomonadales bacterium]|nr:hypothetical protein [Pseudomonadales bacterium]
MSTFQAVDDAVLVRMIGQAHRRVVYVAPGVFTPVANALGKVFERDAEIAVTVIVDCDEDVCRIGFGDIEGLKTLSELARKRGMFLRSQPGVRVGVLLVDDQTLVWSPTARSVEAPPASEGDRQPKPNGMLLGSKPGEQIALAIAAEGTDSHFGQAEIGKTAVTDQQVKDTVESLTRNPPIPVDLARISRVFSTKLQFVELKVTHARLSQRQLHIESSLLNADAKNELQSLINSKLKAFGELREMEFPVPAYVNGKPAEDREGKPLLEPVSETILESERRVFERRYLYDIAGYGRLIERDRKTEFQALVDAYKVRLEAYSTSLRAKLDEQANRIVSDAVELITFRATRGVPGASPPDAQAVAAALRKSLGKAKDEPPKLTLVFKDVTYEQTQAPEFQAKVDKALPIAVRRRLGPWHEHFDAARQQIVESNNAARSDAK